MKIFFKTHGLVLYEDTDITDKITAFYSPTNSHFKLCTQSTEYHRTLTMVCICAYLK